MDSLEQRIVSISSRAAATGALVSLPTTTTTIEDGGIPFVVHLSELQENKAAATRSQKRRGSNPFLPPDPELMIDELPPRHVSVLNKFNVLRHHLLIVTKDYVPQTDLLDRSDFEALGRCMSQLDGLGFYNGGTTAGASQPHKHLQLVPLPLGPGPEPTPLDVILGQSGRPDVVDTVEDLPFTNAVVRLDGQRLTGDLASRLQKRYREALTEVGIDDGSRPYNMLLTRRWMLIVPRSREYWRRVSVNALGFAGSLLVRTHQELEELQNFGPLSVLRSVVENTP